MHLRETLKLYNPSSRQIEVTALINSEATRERVLEEIGILHGRLKSNDVGIVAYSGYESVLPIKPGKRATFYILPYDGDLKRPTETAISAADILRALPDSRGQVVFWLDTCHSGKLAEEMQLIDPAIIIFASAAADELSAEDGSFGGGC